MEFGRDLKLIVFDLDGTLIHLDVDWPELRRQIGVDGGTEPLGAAIQRWTLARDPRIDVVTDSELAALGDRTVSPAVSDVLDRLGASHKLAVLTRNSSRAAHRALRRVPGADRICVVGREECPRLKPAPDGLLKILAEFAILPEQAAMVGDTDHDVRAAAAAGVWSVIVRNDRLARPPEGADHYVDHLDDLAALLH